MAKRKRTK